MKDAVFLKQMRLLNKHLASSKKDLSSLLKDDEPSVTLKDGSVHYFDKKELEKIAEIIPGSMHKTLRLPIFIELSSSKYGTGAARISGRSECLLISSLLGKETSGDEMFIYRPDLRVVRRKLRTATQHMFTTSVK